MVNNEKEEGSVSSPSTTKRGLDIDDIHLEDDDEAEVVVEEEEEMEIGMEMPLQILRTGTSEDNYSFTLIEKNLNHIMKQVPKDMKVSIVSVVGAFRTGKSFLLTFLLRYLKYANQDDHHSNTSEDWMFAEGDCLKEGNQNTNNENETNEKSHSSFEWRGGKDRMTTGVWMWSKPFIKEHYNGEKMAVLIMDTQGMFDNETSMSLTSCIFGLSTLISSYQIYNVQNRIQEDNLQHLALFAEYGRMALCGDNNNNNNNIDDKKKGGGEDETDGEDDQNDNDDDDNEEEEIQPFQRLEFLVRDWQDFDITDEEEETGNVDMNKMRKAMDNYLGDVINKGNFKDLKETREQIHSCFEKVTCFMLSHPGLAIPKKTYNGSISKIDPLFRKLLNEYAREIFSVSLEPKRINGRFLTASELQEFIIAYSTMFKNGANFPEAKTMLEVTSEANNRTAKDQSFHLYQDKMDQIIGPKSIHYVKVSEFEEWHKTAEIEAMKLFDKTANMGRKDKIKEYRTAMSVDINKEYERYSELNSSRNPFRNIEYYIVPLMIALTSFIANFFVGICTGDVDDNMIIPDICDKTSNAFYHIYTFVICGILILSAGKIKALYEYLKQTWPQFFGLAVAAVKEKAS